MTFMERLDEHCRSVGIPGLARTALENEGEQAKVRIGHWLCEIGFFGWPEPRWSGPHSRLVHTAAQATAESRPGARL